jgi:hypothetical protein
MKVVPMTKLHAMKTFRREQVQFHASITSILQLHVQLHVPISRLPEKKSPFHMKLRGGWVGSRAVLDDITKNKKPFYYSRESNSSHPVHSH